MALFILGSGGSTEKYAFFEEKYNKTSIDS
jgi:hypothetical protein